jgi:hypothetical protein
MTPPPRTSASTATDSAPRYRAHEIGAYDDEAPGCAVSGGSASATPTPRPPRRCVQWMVEAGLEVHVDGIGNV